jgi:hypothetical protein
MASIRRECVSGVMVSGRFEPTRRQVRDALPPSHEMMPMVADRRAVPRVAGQSCRDIMAAEVLMIPTVEAVVDAAGRV